MRGILKRYMAGLSVMMVFCLLWTQVSLAAPPPVTPTAQTAINLRQAELGLKLRPFTQFTDTGIKFDQSGAIKAGLPKADVLSVAALYEKLNAELTKQDFNWKGLASDRAKGEALLVPSEGVEGDATHSGNFWWWRITFTEWETQLIVKSMTFGASAAGLYAIIAALPGVTLPAAVIFGIAAAVLALGAAYIDLVDYIGGNRGV